MYKYDISPLQEILKNVSCQLLDHGWQAVYSLHANAKNEVLKQFIVCQVSLFICLTEIN